MRGRLLPLVLRAVREMIIIGLEKSAHLFAELCMQQIRKWTKWCTRGQCELAVWSDREETGILRADELASQGFLVDRAAVAVFECRHALILHHASSNMRRLSRLRNAGRNGH